MGSNKSTRAPKRNKMSRARKAHWKLKKQLAENTATLQVPAVPVHQSIEKFEVTANAKDRIQPSSVASTSQLSDVLDIEESNSIPTIIESSIDTDTYYGDSSDPCFERDAEISLKFKSTQGVIKLGTDIKENQFTQSDKKYIPPSFPLPKQYNPHETDEENLLDLILKVEEVDQIEPSTTRYLSVSPPCCDGDMDSDEDIEIKEEPIEINEPITYNFKSVEDKNIAKKKFFLPTDDAPKEMVVKVPNVLTKKLEEQPVMLQRLYRLKVRPVSDDANQSTRNVPKPPAKCYARKPKPSNINKNLVLNSLRQPMPPLKLIENLQNRNIPPLLTQHVVTTLPPPISRQIIENVNLPPLTKIRNVAKTPQLRKLPPPLTKFLDLTKSIVPITLTKVAPPLTKIHTLTQLTDVQKFETITKETTPSTKHYVRKIVINPKKIETITKDSPQLRNIQKNLKVKTIIKNTSQLKNIESSSKTDSPELDNEHDDIIMNIADSSIAAKIGSSGEADGGVIEKEIKTDQEVDPLLGDVDVINVNANLVKKVYHKIVPKLVLVCILCSRPQPILIPCLNMKSKILFISQIDIYPKFGEKIFPKACKECLMKVEAFWDFKNTIISSYELLHSTYVSKSKSNLENADSTTKPKNVQQLKLNRPSSEEAAADELERPFQPSADELPYHCIICGVRFKSAIHVERHHFEDHLNSKCNLCDESFSDYVAYVYHVLINHKKQHTKESTRLLCFICGQTHSKWKESVHMFKHFPTCNFMCDVCGKAYASNHQLKRHFHRHNKKHECEICQRKFAHPIYLERHLRSHTGDRPFECDFCDRKFSCYWNMMGHRRIHTNTYPYKCVTCSQAFRHNVSRKRHELKCDGTYDASKVENKRSKQIQAAAKQWQRQKSLETGGKPRPRKRKRSSSTSSESEDDEEENEEYLCQAESGYSDMENDEDENIKLDELSADSQVDENSNSEDELETSISNNSKHDEDHFGEASVHVDNSNEVMSNSDVEVLKTTIGDHSNLIEDLSKGADEHDQNWSDAQSNEENSADELYIQETIVDKPQQMECRLQESHSSQVMSTDPIDEDEPGTHLRLRHILRYNSKNRLMDKRHLAIRKPSKRIENRLKLGVKSKYDYFNKTNSNIPPKTVEDKPETNLYTATKSTSGDSSKEVEERLEPHIDIETCISVDIILKTNQDVN